MLCNVVLVSIAQQSEPSGGIHIPPLFFGFPLGDLGHHSGVP